MQDDGDRGQQLPRLNDVVGRQLARRQPSNERVCHLVGEQGGCVKLLTRGLPLTYLPLDRRRAVAVERQDDQ